MNREILFKAKRKDNGEWAEGCLIIDYVSGQYFIHQNGNSVNESPKIGEEGCLRFLTFEIDSDTICQYTGLTDKNGKKIWENDIVLLREEIQDYEWKAMVKFGNPNWEYNWGWKLVPIGECDMNKDILLWIDMEIATCEIIGNFFDNPDLLEVK